MLSQVVEIAFGRGIPFLGVNGSEAGMGSYVGGGGKDLGTGRLMKLKSKSSRGGMQMYLLETCQGVAVRFFFFFR